LKTKSLDEVTGEVRAPGEDLGRKIADYASLGVPEVWVISPESRTLEVLGFRKRQLAPQADGTFTSPRHPNVTVNAADLWSDWRPQRVE
jgi:Uma2 family endonuclease